jgi:hypothetical protein
MSRRHPVNVYARVYNMHDAFADLEGYAKHIIETTGRSAENVRAECIHRRRRHAFLLDTRHLIP